MSQVIFGTCTANIVEILVCVDNDTATTEIYTYRHTLSLHDALPISLQPATAGLRLRRLGPRARERAGPAHRGDSRFRRPRAGRSGRDRKSTRLNSSH